MLFFQIYTKCPFQQYITCIGNIGGKKRKNEFEPQKMVVSGRFFVETFSNSARKKDLLPLDP